jgi:hypothetical protein
MEDLDRLRRHYAGLPGPAALHVLTLVDALHEAWGREAALETKLQAAEEALLVQKG